MTRRGWHRSLGALLLIALLLCIGSVNQLYNYWQQQIMLHSSQQNEQLALHMESLLDGIDNHVKRLQHAAHLALHGQTRVNTLGNALQPALPSGVGGYTLDVLQQSSPSAQLGNVFLATDPDEPKLEPELRIISALFPLAAADHLTDSSLQWSYYNSLQYPLLGIFPYRNTEQLLRDNKIATLSGMFAEFMNPDIQQRLLVDLGDLQGSVWRAPHIDKAGAGWVVPLVAPVRSKGVIIGVVSSDVRLPFLSAHLAKLTLAPERTMLIDDTQLVLADSRLSQEPATRLSRIGERLPVSMAALTAKLTRANPGWHSAGDYHLLLRPLAHSQWTLVRLIPSDELLFNVRLRTLAVALPVVLLWAGLVLVWWRRRVAS